MLTLRLYAAVVVLSLSKLFHALISLLIHIPVINL